MTSHHSNIGFQNLRICAMGRGPAIQPAHTLKATMMAEFDFTMEIEFLFPRSEERRVGKECRL